jgi:hypothetical protein
MRLAPLFQQLSEHRGLFAQLRNWENLPNRPPFCLPQCLYRKHSFLGQPAPVILRMSRDVL